MSEDATRAILGDLQKMHANLRVVDNPRKIVTTALNIAISEARGEYIVRCDAHAAYSRDYISSCIETAEKTGAANVGGHMRAAPSSATPIAHSIVLAHYSKFGLGGGRFHDPNYEGYVETVWLGCYRSDVLRKIGPYNELLPRSEDIDLNSRLVKAGFKIYLSSKIKAFYFCRPNLRLLWKQRWADGAGIVQSMRLNPGSVRPRHCAPMVGAAICIAVILWALIAFLAHQVAITRWAALTACIGGETYLCAAIGFALSSFFTTEWVSAIIVDERLPGVKIKRSAALLLPLVFATLHFSYGLGSLAGLLKKS